MQSTTLYLYDQSVSIFVDADTQKTFWEYDMHNLPIKIYKGIDNKVQLLVKDNDQQPINLTNATITFNVLDPDTGQINVTKTASILNERKGIAQVILLQADINSFEGKYLRYSAILNVDEVVGDQSLFVNAGVNAGGDIELIHDVYPVVVSSNSVIVSNPGPGNTFTSDIFDAKPELNRNNALHTVQVYFDNYTGDFVVEGSMSNNAMPDNTEFFTIDTLTYTNQTANIYYNFTGVYKKVRFKVTATSGDVTKILYRP